MNGVILEFILFPDVSELHKKYTGSSHAKFSMVLRQDDANFISCSAGALCANLK
jgi:hypothetical protein